LGVAVGAIVATTILSDETCTILKYFINMKVSEQDLLLGHGCHILHGGQLLKDP
jgi:hypothetical protein